MQDEKAQLRRHFRQLREGLAPATRVRYDRAILANLQTLPEMTTAGTVFTYISSGAEADTRVLLDWLQEDGRRMLVPEIRANGLMIAAVFSGWDTLRTGKFGIPEPVSPVPYEGQIDLCITPGLAFTPEGVRLGQGLGYYDRWFASHPVRCRLALAYECQITDRLPAGSHDTVVDIVVTEQRIIRVS